MKVYVGSIKVSNLPSKTVIAARLKSCLSKLILVSADSTLAVVQ